MLELSGCKPQKFNNFFIYKYQMNMLNRLFIKFSMYWRANTFERAYLLANVRSRLVGRLFYRRWFKYFGDRSFIKSPAQLIGTQNISIGSDVRIENGVILYAVRKYAGKNCAGSIEIGDHVYINRNFNSSAAAPILIGSHVTIATNVFICNYDHGYDYVDMPINAQPLKVHGEISIGSGSWLGANVCVLGNVSIGRHVVIGANSVVITDIPDYSVAVGVPARVVKRFDFDSGIWRNIKI